VPAQVAVVGERGRSCASCGHKLASKGHYPVTFRCLFGDVPVRVRRLLVCPCQGQSEVKSFGVLNFGDDAVAPELAYVTARFAALTPFGKSRSCCPSCFRSAGRRTTRAQSETGRGGWVKRLCASTHRDGNADRDAVKWPRGDWT
jgi:hypothetical protein